MSRTFETLNGVRGLAAIFVVLLHSSGLFGFNPAPGGYLAVDLFFCLSGFVIAHAYGDRLRDGLTTASFIRLRLIRFYPLYAAGLILGFLAALAQLAVSPTHSAGLSRLLFNLGFGLFFLPSPTGGTLYPFNLPAWSLWYELLVNIVYAFVLFRFSSRALASLTAATFVFLAAMTLSGEHGLAFGPVASEWPGAAARTLFSFSVGLLIYRTRNSWDAPRVPAVILVVVTVVPMLLPVSALARPIFDLALVALWFPALITLSARVEPVIGASALRFLGVASYGLYAIHYPVVQVLLAVKERTGFQGFNVGLAVVFALVAVAWVLDARFDIPTRRLLSGLTKRRASPGDQTRTAESHSLLETSSEQHPRA